jgi:predicted O-linked N-acetylglucosamine transferase (SPINDLY family)
MTGIWLGSSMAYGYLSPLALPRPGRSSRFFPALVCVLSAVAAVWGIIFIKDTAALAYFAKGLQALSVANDPVSADNDFRMSVTLNPMDIYWQGRAEASLAMARALLASLNSSSDASTTQAAASRTMALGNQASQYAAKAVAADPTNYYNYVSEARVAELATSLKMQNGYQAGVQAYSTAIALNPGNPSLYLSLARLEVSQNQLDAALQTIGASLQVKNNYLDAVFLLTQVEAAKGNLPDAITAARFAIGLNDANPLLYFELGLLQYVSKDYADAAVTLAQAVKLQPDYANAQYFLGLSYAQLNRIPDAAAQFEQLSVSNPGNQEVALILANLRAGKSPFAGATPPASTAPEKRSSPPIPEKKP